MAEITVPNGGFEEGNLNSWTILRGDAGKITVSSGDRAPYEGTYGLAVRAEGEIEVQNDTFFDVVPGDAINISCWMMPTRGSDRGTVRVWWFDENNSPINPPHTDNPHNTPGHISGTGGYRESRLTNNAVPTSARKFKVGFYARKYSESAFSVDSFRVDVTPNRSITLVAPADGSEWVEGDTIQFQSEVGGNTPPVSRVEYLVDGAVVGNSSAAPYRYNFLNAQAGVYEVQARLVLQGNITLLSGVHTFTVVEGEPPPPPTDPREYNASNAYTNLVLENFSGLSSQIPSTALVAGVEVEIDFALEVLSRTKDIGIDDPSNANDLAPFDIVKNVEAHVSLLDTQGGYSVQGQAEVVSVPIIHTDFPQVETGITDNMKWSVRRNTTPYTIRLGEEDFLWGQDGMAFPDFSSSALGIKFIPRVGAKPEYADAGDAAFRFLIDRVRILVYFDAGSVEYYFASPSGDDVLKGVLAAYCVHGGEWSSGDAYGELQLTPDLEVMDGSAVVIGDEWTIHSSYPPTSSNQIGIVEADEEGWGMRYNGLPTQEDIKNNRSRYEFISTNFYGDKGMYSFYGVHGLERSFAYNNDFFYKICTQPDAGKDRPRHIANHHGHLALGYGDGRVDLSVVGEPYNFDGALGASSWATADPVTGLLPLSGMVLGIFGEKSVTGLSGTTVDNFATQIISAKMGAIEYTIADMGFPVYANHYGIYTLSQVQQYGDFMGTPLSQDISPWLRPRLVRSYTKDEEVVCAWPVRSKNQYRLAFGDGAILTMTINNGQQGSPTFSKQKYFKSQVSSSGDGWTPIAESGLLASFDQEGENWDGDPFATMEGSTVTTIYTSHYNPANWSVGLTSPALVRINGEITSSYADSADSEYFVLGDQIVENTHNDGTGWRTKWDPNPIYSDNEVSTIYYESARDPSDYQVGSGTFLIEVWVEPEECEVSYDMEAIVPIAVSSELSHTGEERIHMAPVIELPPPPPPPPPRPDPLYITSTEGMTAFSVNWPEGYNYDSTIEIYKDGNIVGDLMCHDNPNEATFTAGTVWHGGFHEQINPGDIVTLKQGDWEAEMYIETNVPLVIAFRPSQTYPVTSSWESELLTYTNTYLEGSVVLRLDGIEYAASSQTIGGTYTWVYDQDFPTEITEWTEAEVSIDGGEFVPAYIIAAAWYPNVSIRTSRWDGSEYRTSVEMFGQEWGGFDAQEDTYFTLTRDGVVYTFTKGAYSAFWCDVDIDTAPPKDEYNPWLMEYEAGSYLVTAGRW